MCSIQLSVWVPDSYAGALVTFKRSIHAGILAALGTLFVSSGFAAPNANAEKPASASPHAEIPQTAQQWALIEKYCVKCHNVEDWAGSVAFDSLSPADIPKDAQVWEAVIRKLRGGFMPPLGSPQPERKEAKGLQSWIETTLDTGSVAADPATSRYVASIAVSTRTRYTTSSDSTWIRPCGCPRTR